MAMTCAICDHTETDPVFLDTETCGLCGEFLEYQDDDFEELDRANDGWHDEWEAAEFGAK